MKKVAQSKPAPSLSEMKASAERSTLLLHRLIKEKYPGMTVEEFFDKGGVDFELLEAAGYKLGPGDLSADESKQEAARTQRKRLDEIADSLGEAWPLDEIESFVEAEIMVGPRETHPLLAQIKHLFRALAVTRNNGVVFFARWEAGRFTPISHPLPKNEVTRRISLMFAAYLAEKAKPVGSGRKAADHWQKIREVAAERPHLPRKEIVFEGLERAGIQPTTDQVDSCLKHFAARTKTTVKP